VYSAGDIRNPSPAPPIALVCDHKPAGTMGPGLRRGDERCLACRPDKRSASGSHLEMQTSINQCQRGRWRSKDSLKRQTQPSFRNRDSDIQNPPAALMH